MRKGLNYTFERAESLADKPRKFRLETNLIGKKLAEHLAAGYKMIN